MIEPFRVTMPKSERLILAHLATAMLPKLSLAHLERMAIYASQLLNQIAIEFGLPNFANTAGSPESLDEILCRSEALARHLPSCRPTNLDRRLDWLCRTVDATNGDRNLLAHLARAQLFVAFDELFTNLGDGPPCSGEVNLAALSLVLGRSGYALKRQLRPQSRLMTSGLVRDCRGDDYAISAFALSIAQTRTTNEDQLASELLPVANPSSLNYEDFEHLGESGALALRLVASAAKRGTGVNLLLFGPPGTGKSEFAKVLASTCGLHPVPVGRTDENGGEPDRGDRLAHLTVCRALVRRSHRHLLIVDEADDLMLENAGGLRSKSKLYLHNLVEQSSVPTVWIINDPALLGAPVSRRMNLTIEFRNPSPSMRRRITERLLAKHRLRFADDQVIKLAALNVAPAILDNGLRTASLTDRSGTTAERAIASVARLVSSTPVHTWTSPATFDPRLCVGSVDVAGLVERLAASPSPAWSLLAYGLPGTGKSALARCIAERAGIPILEKKGSDLLDMYVGNTEKGIARAFTEAADTGAMLILDEADTLLRDRRLAHRGWEASMTNEMLTWMERSHTPFVATTNLEDQLDPATSRRFLFKVKFEAPDAEQRRALFQHYFQQPAPAALDRLAGLTPGDFALVARRSAILGRGSSKELVTLLAEEVAYREGSRARLGF